MSQLIRIVILLSTFALAGGCLPAGSPGGGGNNGAGNNGAGNAGGGNNGGSSNNCEPADSDICQVFEIVNIERSEAGEEPLVYNMALERAAQAHAEDMAEKGYFSHTAPDGSDFSARADAAGYTGFPGGENIAQGQRSPEQVMNSWMNSQGHRENILRPRFDEIGVGLHQGYWVQVFGQRR